MPIATVIKEPTFHPMSPPSPQAVCEVRVNMRTRNSEATNGLTLKKIAIEPLKPRGPARKLIAERPCFEDIS